MICSKCNHWQQPEVKVRMTPTFYHSPIFHPNEDYGTNKPMRCSATFHSTVFDNAHHHKRKTQPKKQQNCCCQEIGCTKTARDDRKEAQVMRRSSPGSQSRFRKQADLHPHTHLSSQQLDHPKLSRHTLLWYNP